MAINEEPDPLEETFVSKLGLTESLQRDLISTELEQLADQHGLTCNEISLSKDYLEDLVTIFKFFRRTKWDSKTAKELIIKNILWRLRSHISSPSERINPSESSLAYLTLSDI